MTLTLTLTVDFQSYLFSYFVSILVAASARRLVPLKTHALIIIVINAVLTCEIKLFQNYSSLRRRVRLK